MTDFLQMLIDCDDFELLLGDMYQPACACIVISWAILSFGAVCQIFSTLVTGLFKSRL